MFFKSGGPTWPRCDARALFGIARPAAALLLAAMATPVVAQHFSAGNLLVDRPWSRQTAPGQKVGGGFLTIANKGKVEDRLISATSPVAAEVQIHTMSLDGGVMRMRPVQGGIAVPAGQNITLKPGGLHLMFIGLNQPLTAGESFPVTLRFQRQGAVKVNFRIMPVGTAASREAHHVPA